MTVPRASVIIPAHNEESVIGRCLSLLGAQSEPDELEIIVVANGCTDGTAAVARASGVRVIETAEPGKANALRVGDAASSVFPRIYLDADVEFERESVRELVKSLVASGKLAAAPKLVLDLDRCSRAMRRVHRVHESLMAPRRALAGVGVYALSAEGHKRVFPLPDVIADDGLVHRLFGPDERVVVQNATSIVRPARTLRSHLRRRVRVRMGGRQLDALGVPSRDGHLRLSSLVALVSRRSVAPVDAAWYLSTTGLDRAMSRFADRNSIVWSVDRSSRQVVG